MVPGDHAGDRRADLGDHARPLVAEHGGEEEGEVAALYGQVGVAHPAGRQPHPDLVGTGRCQLDVADLEWRAHLRHHGGPHVLTAVRSGHGHRVGVGPRP